MARGLRAVGPFVSLHAAASLRGAVKMRQVRRRSRVTLAIFLLIAAAPSSGCASDWWNTPIWSETSTDPKEVAAATARLPPNYRELMAQYIRLHCHCVVLDAKISPPYEKYGGLLRGGTNPAVCVAVYRDNPLGITIRDHWVLTFENGQLGRVPIGLDSCADLSPFPELAGAART